MKAQGEAYMMCLDCNGKLWSFDGYEDRIITCPYLKDPIGECIPGKFKESK